MISEPLTLSKTHPVLSAQGLTRCFGGLIAVNDVSFTVEKHEIFGLIGPNGAGKTTLFNLMTGLIPSNSGKLIYQNEDISQLKPHQIANKGIARTFQNIRLFGELSVSENVAIARHIHSRSHNPVLLLLAGIFALPSSNAMERETRAKALELLELVGLGDRPRIDVAPETATIRRTQFGLAPAIVKEILAIIQHSRSTGVTILLVEQNASLAWQIADRGYVPEAGNITQTGMASDLLKDDELGGHT